MSGNGEIRVVWGTPAVPGGRWVFSVLNVRTDTPEPRAAVPSGNGHRLHVSLGGVALWLLTMGVAAYLAGAALVLYRLKAAYPHLRASYVDVVLPGRWSGLEPLRGAALVDQAREAIAQGKFSEGFVLLRQGLARNPADFSARLDIAGVYATNSLKPHAIKLLKEGLAYGYPGRPYLQTLASLLTESDQPDLKHELLAAARESFHALPESSRTAGDRAWLDEQVARALAGMGRDAEALAFLEKHQPAANPAVRRFVTSRLLALDRASEAASIARQWALDFPREAEPLCVLADSLRASGDLAGMDQALQSLERLNPALPDALLYSVIQNHQAGRPTEAARKLDQLIFRHGSTASFYTVVCTSFLGFGHEAGLVRLETEMRERGLSPRPVFWARLKLAEQAKDWSGLLVQLEKLRSTSGPAFSATDLAYLETVERLAMACLDAASGTQASLVEAVRSRQGSVALYRTLVESLLHAERPATAREIFALSEHAFPDSRTLRELRPRIDAALAASAAPSREVDRPQLPFEDWASFLSAVNARVDADDSEGAFALFSGLRRAQPAWLQEAALRVDALELPLLARSADPLRLQILARSALLRDPSAPDALLRLARALHSEGFGENARLLCREIVRHAPTHEAALAYLKVVDPSAGRNAAESSSPDAGQASSE